MLKPYVDTGGFPPLRETVKSVYETVLGLFDDPRHRNNVEILDHGQSFRVRYRDENNVVLISMISQGDDIGMKLYIDIRQDGMSNFYIISPNGECKIYYFDSDEDYKSGVCKQDMLGISSSVSNEDLLSLINKLTSIFSE